MFIGRPENRQRGTALAVFSSLTRQRSAGNLQHRWPSP
jgi:hypothetical protein